MIEPNLGKRLPMKQPTINPMTAWTVDVPAKFANADVIEIRVTLTPLRWNEADNQHVRVGDIAGAQVQIVRLEARDSRAVFHIVRQMLRALVAEYLGLKDVF